MNKKIKMIGMSVLLTMTTGLKAQQEILDKNDFFDGRTWTTVSTHPCEDDHYYVDTSVKHKGTFWEQSKELILGVASLTVIPIISMIMWRNDDTPPDLGPSGTSGGGSGGSSGGRLTYAVQCIRIAQSTGQQCQRMTKNANRDCGQH